MDCIGFFCGIEKHARLVMNPESYIDLSKIKGVFGESGKLSSSLFTQLFGQRGKFPQE